MMQAAFSDQELNLCKSHIIHPKAVELNRSSQYAVFSYWLGILEGVIASDPAATSFIDGKAICL